MKIWLKDYSITERMKLGYKKTFGKYDVDVLPSEIIYPTKKKTFYL